MLIDINREFDYQVYLKIYRLDIIANNYIFPFTYLHFLCAFTRNVSVRYKVRPARNMLLALCMFQTTQGIYCAMSCLHIYIATEPLLLTNSMAYRTRKLNAAFTRTLQ